MSYSTSAPSSTWLRPARTNTSRMTKPSAARPATIASSRPGTSPASLSRRARSGVLPGESGQACASTSPAVIQSSPSRRQCRRALSLARHMRRGARGSRILAAVRVLTVGNMYPPHHFGGYELVWRSAVEHLRSRGHEVEVLTTDTDTGAKEPDPPGVYRELHWRIRDAQVEPINRLGQARLRPPHH